MGNFSNKLQDEKFYEKFHEKHKISIARFVQMSTKIDIVVTVCLTQTSVNCTSSGSQFFVSHVQTTKHFFLFEKTKNGDGQVIDLNL